MDRLTSLLLVCVVFGVVAIATAADPKPEADVKAIIDSLKELERQDTGYSGSDSGTAFLPYGRNERGAALLSPRQGKFGSSDAMKSLVKLGVKAVPTLLEHLSDDRKTKIVLSHSGGFGGMFIAQDDDEKKKDDAEEKGEKKDDFFGQETKYTVRVGDLCYVALGQIVNREYTTVRYQPTAIVIVTCVPKCKKLREELVKEWGKLTPESQQKSLANDLDSDREDIRNGASVRLAYYHPDALEPLAIKQLERPTYDVFAVSDLIRQQLYPAKTAKERKELVDKFVKKHGEIARDGIRWDLFDDLRWQIAEEEGRTSSKQNPPYRARECLIDVFGMTDKATSKDRPEREPLAATTQARFIKTLVFDRSEKLDHALRDILAKTDDDYLAEGCLDRLVGRGYDAEIEAYLKRRLPQKKEEDRQQLRQYEAKLGWTLLHKAVELDVPELIEAALKDKLDVNAQGKDGRTALHLAAADGKLAAVERVLAAKADPNVKDANGKLPVQLAAFGDHPEVVRRLVAGKSQIPDALVAATAGDADRLTELLKAKAERAKERTEGGFTPLHLAAREGHEKAVTVLLDAGADVSATDAPTGRYSSPDGWTPLHLAVMTEKAAVVKLLLGRKADGNATDQRGKLTPLHYAAWVGNADVVAALLDAKADRGAMDEKGRTPFDLAKERKHTAVVKLLEK